MIVLGISTSPRKKGNSEAILDRVLSGSREAGAEIRKIYLSELEFSPCLECEKIKDDGTCIVKDDLQPVFRAIEKADVVVFVSPIFFGSVSAQAKMMIDRYQCYWRAKFILETIHEKKKRKGIFIAVSAGDRRKFFNNAKAVARNFFATIGAKCYLEVMFSRVANKGDAAKNKKVMDKAFEIGKSVTKSFV